MSVLLRNFFVFGHPSRKLPISMTSIFDTLFILLFLTFLSFSFLILWGELYSSPRQIIQRKRKEKGPPFLKSVFSSSFFSLASKQLFSQWTIILYLLYYISAFFNIFLFCSFLPSKLSFIFFHFLRADERVAWGAILYSCWLGSNSYKYLLHTVTHTHNKEGIIKIETEFGKEKKTVDHWVMRGYETSFDNK